MVAVVVPIAVIPTHFFFCCEQARVPTELLNRLEPYFTQEFKDTVQLEEKAESGAEEAAL